MARNKYEKYFDRVGTGLDPVSIQCGITDFCYNECTMCGHHKRKDKTFLDYGDWIHFLSQRNQLKSVCYSGGDPFTYSHFNFVMDYHIERELPFGVITSGVCDNINLDKLKYASFVAVSLDAIDNDIYAKQRGGQITATDVMEGIDQMLAAGVTLKLGITVTRHNAEHVQDIIQWADSRIFKKILIHPPYNSNIKLPNYLSRNHLVVYKYRELDTSMKCSVPFYHMFVDAHGDVYHCCLTAGDTQNKPQGEALGNICNWKVVIWNRYIFYEHYQLKKETVCNSCQDRLNGINTAVQQLNNKHIFF